MFSSASRILFGGARSHAEPGRVAMNSRRRGDGGGFGIWPRGVASSDRGEAGEDVVVGRFGSDDGQSGSITAAAGLRREA